MLSLKDRLCTAEDEFLAALMKGSDGVSAFYERWEALVLELESSLDSTNPDPELASLAHAVASRCATLAETSADLLSRNDTLSQELMGELDSLMSELTIHDSPKEAGLPLRVEGSRTNSHSAGGKRRRSEEESEKFDVQRKRRRSTSDERKSSPIFPHLSSASHSSFCLSSTRLPSHFPSPIPSTLQSRKRRLSDAESCSPARTSKRFHVGPRLHAVSDSFTLQRNDWFQTSTWEAVSNDADSYLDSPPNVTSLLDLSALDDLNTPVAIDSLPVVEVSSADIHQRSFWPSSTTNPALSDLESLDSFLQSLLHAEDVITFPPPSTPCASGSQKVSSSLSYPFAPLHTSLTETSSHFKASDPFFEVPPMASSLFALVPSPTDCDTAINIAPQDDPPSLYVDSQDWQCVFDTLRTSPGIFPSSYADSSSSESDDEVPTPRTVSPAPLPSKTKATSSLPLVNMSIVMPPFVTSF